MLGLESFLIMTKRLILAFLLSLILPLLAAQTTSAVLRSKHILPAAPGARGGQLQLSGFFVEVDGKRIDLPDLASKAKPGWPTDAWSGSRPSAMTTISR